MDNTPEIDIMKQLTDAENDYHNDIKVSKRNDTNHIMQSHQKIQLKSVDNLFHYSNLYILRHHIKKKKQLNEFETLDITW